MADTFYIKSYGMYVAEQPIVLLRLTLPPREEGSETPYVVDFVLGLDQTDILVADLISSKTNAIHEFMLQSAAVKDLKEDLKQWEEGTPPLDPPADE